MIKFLVSENKKSTLNRGQRYIQCTRVHGTTTLFVQNGKTSFPNILSSFFFKPRFKVSSQYTERPQLSLSLHLSDQTVYAKQITAVDFRSASSRSQKPKLTPSKAPLFTLTTYLSVLSSSSSVISVCKAFDLERNVW